jgi:hypothetical protein
VRVLFPAQGEIRSIENGNGHRRSLASRDLHKTPGKRQIRSHGYASLVPPTNDKVLKVADPRS